MISQRQCMSPRESVEPMYIPGRLRTASSPSRTDRCRAVYALGSEAVRPLAGRLGEGAVLLAGTHRD